MKNIIIATIVGILTFSFVSCKKEGPGGESEIAIWVKHHDQLIPGATVYIKYGTDEFPGEDLTVYDDSEVCGTEGESEGHTHFHDLNRGDYYLYAVGYDSSISHTVKGGIPVKLSSDEKEVEVPVTEE